MQNDPDFLFYLDPVMNDDLRDLRYLFKTGLYISDNEIQMAEFMNSYPDEKITLLAKTISEAYQRGFVRDGKDLSKKTTVSLYYRVGMEKLYRALIKEFQKINLKPTVTRVDSKRPNRQYDYDTKFNNALYVSDAWAEKVVPSMEKGIGQSKKLLEQMSDVVAIINFGEERYAPVNKPENLKLTQEQTKIYQQVVTKSSMIYQKYQNRSETSFCIVAFPSPDIGKNFEQIFEKTIEINTIDTEKTEQIQQKIIDILDQADKVVIKGKGKNKTDLTVTMQELANPEKETNFVNSGSSVNIPAGEVFTSPQLKGTTGVLHVSKSYQNNVLFKDLTITFEDGYITNYSCSNFDSNQENKEYIEQNLLFPHKTLPMGEFAIGTNTLAYVYSRQYDILDVLPILISEKTAPHFAIGDTCFSHSEDVPRHNRFNNKLIVACDNEKSLLRKTDKKEEAYTNIHNDIVLPFDEISKITAITTDEKKIDIIKDGLFVLEGTEELNKPLLDYRKK
jgi:leucyl aminopeptidase (aminopeptidase T)